MTSEPITRCVPGARTRKDQIKPRAKPDMPTQFSTEALGLRSGQTTLTKAQQETEAEIMAVALNQPHRVGLPPYQQTDADYWSSELGKFVRRYHSGGDDPKTYRDSTPFARYRAGTRFAQVIDDDLVASGLAPRQRGEAEWAGELSQEAVEARKELCRYLRANVEATALSVDPRAVASLRTLCHEGMPIPERLHSLTRNALYLVSIHFGIEKPGFHAERD